MASSPIFLLVVLVVLSGCATERPAVWGDARKAAPAGIANVLDGYALAELGERGSWTGPYNVREIARFMPADPNTFRGWTEFIRGKEDNRFYVLSNFDVVDYQEHGSVHALGPLPRFIVYIEPGGGMHWLATPYTEEEMVLGLKILRVFKDGFVLDFSDGSSVQTVAQAEVLTREYHSRIVALAYLSTHALAGLHVGDVVKCRIKRRIVEEHLEATKDPVKAYSHLNAPDFVVLEIVPAAQP